MQTTEYRQSLTDAINQLVEIRNLLFDSIVQLGMEGELKEWNDLIEAGESFEFNKEMFQNSSDTNLQKLVSLLDEVENTYESLINLNNLKPDQ